MEIITEKPVTWALHSLDKAGSYGKYYVKMNVDAGEGKYLVGRLKAAIHEAKTEGLIPQNCSPKILNIKDSLYNLAANGGEVSANSLIRPPVFDLDDNELSIVEIAQIPQGAKGRVMVKAEILSLNYVSVVRLELLALQLFTADSQPVRHFSRSPFSAGTVSVSGSATGTSDFLC